MAAPSNQSTIDYESFSKFSQMYNSFHQDDYPHKLSMANALKRPGNINYKLPRTIKSSRRLDGNTILHVAAMKNNTNIYTQLLNNKADIAAQNHEGRTALHLIFNQRNPNKDIINLTLSTQLSLGDSSNPRDCDGLSHFHIACMYNRVDVVEFFLDNDIDVNMAVNSSAKRFAGYTGLHFATNNLAMTVITRLLERNASISVQDAHGLTPFHMLITAKMKLFEKLNAGVKSKSITTMMAAIEDTTNLILDSNYVDHLGFTRLHNACMQRDTSMAEYFLNKENIDISQQVNLKSPIYPGYTALHFAAHCNLRIARLLLKKKANHEARDANGQTPIDLIWTNSCNRQYDDILAIIKQKWKYLTFSDDKTGLMDFARGLMWPKQTVLYYDAMEGYNLHVKIDNTPVYWRGRNLLHFAVMFCDRYDNRIMKNCLFNDYNILVHKRDFYGSTPIHLAFRLGKFKAVKLLLMLSNQSYENLADQDGLSYLQIVCALGVMEHVKKFCTTPVYAEKLKDTYMIHCYHGQMAFPGIISGTTALHIAMSKANLLIVLKLLQKMDCNLTARDAKGRTPLHLLFQWTDVKNIKEVCRVLLQRRIVTNNIMRFVGVTPVHLAVYIGSCVDIDNYVTQTNIEMRIQCDDELSILREYHGCTPLHMAVMRGADVEVLNILLKRGADILAMNNDRGETPLYLALDCKPTSIDMEVFVRKLQYDVVLCKKLEAMSGITMLHIACHVAHLEAISWLLIGEVDVNAKVKCDSTVWPGYTPLHILVIHIKRCGFDDNARIIVDLLLSAGADPTALNENGETPIHLALSIVKDNRTAIFTTLQLLFDNLRVFDVNPSGIRGVSHFHVACLLNNVDAIKSFLDNNVAEVNRPIDFFSNYFPGETPLHLAMLCPNNLTKIETLDLLLSHGADVNAEDSAEHNALHKAAKWNSDWQIFQKLVEYGAMINSENLFGETPLEILLMSGNATAEAIKFFIGNGCRLNTSNSLSERGYMSILICTKGSKSRVKFCKDKITYTYHDVTFDIVDSYLLDDSGRSILHNIVTTNVRCNVNFSYHELIKRFLQAGVDINLRDKKGKTALHLAAQFGSFAGLEGLLDNGADINILDADGKTPLSYAIKYQYNKKYCPELSCHKKVISCLTSHLKDLQLFGFHVNSQNREDEHEHMDLQRAYEAIYDYRFSKETKERITTVRELVIDNEPTILTLKDFLSETGKGLTGYPLMSKRRRDVIDQFFQNYYGDFRSMCSLQYQKSLKRVELVKLAIPAVWLIAGINIPIECCEVFFEYLSNNDLENLIEATGV